MFINITDSETGNNKGSSSALVNYLEKENRLPEHKNNPEYWFNGQFTNISPQEVRVKIDNNVAKLGKNDAKFFLINISPSQKEIKWLKEKFGEHEAENQFKIFALKVMDEYAKNFKRLGVESNSDLLWYGKLEHFRYYNHIDAVVEQGCRNKGDRKEGEQMHIQVIVNRKDITNKIKLSPMNNSRGKNAALSAKFGQFDRKAFKQSGESLFDEMFGFERNLKETMEYAATIKNGSSEQKKKLYKLENVGYNELISGKSIKGTENGFDSETNITHKLIEGFLSLLFEPDSTIYEYFEDNIYSTKKNRKKKRRK